MGTTCNIIGANFLYRKDINFINVQLTFDIPSVI